MRHKALHYKGTWGVMAKRSHADTWTAIGNICAPTKAQATRCARELAEGRRDLVIWAICRQQGPDYIERVSLPREPKWNIDDHIKPEFQVQLFPGGVK